MKVKSIEKETEIVQVVIDITYEVGLAGLKMSKIAKRAGFAHGTVYIYFDNKKDLINKTFQKVKREATISIGTEQVIEGDFITKLRAIWEGFISYLIHYQKETHFLKQCLESPFLDGNSKKMSDGSKQNLMHFFEKGKNDKYVKEMDTELLLSVFSGLAKEIVFKINQGTVEMNEQLIEDSFELCWNAIRR